MLLAQTSSRSLRRSLLTTSSSRSLSSSFAVLFPRSRPFTASCSTRTLGELAGFKRPPHRDLPPSSPSSSATPPRPRSWSPLLPSTWASQFLSTPSSRTAAKADSSAPSPSPPPAPPPPATGIIPSADPSATSPPPPPSDPNPPPLPLPAWPSSSLPTEQNLSILQSTLLDSLHVGRSLHGKTLASPRGESVSPEPIVGVYCPLEGGSYVIDAGLEEVASRIGADLVQLDAVELAAEGQGKLGPATSAIPLAPNPLKVGRDVASALSSETLSSPAEDEGMEEEEEEDLDDEEPLPGPPPPVQDHSLSSFSATKNSDWKAGALAVVESASKEDTPLPPVPALEETKEATEDEEVNHAPRDESPFSTLEELMGGGEPQPIVKSSTPTSQEVLSRLFSEIVNVEGPYSSPSHSTPSSTSADLTSLSLGETSLLSPSTSTLPSLASSSSPASASDATPTPFSLPSALPTPKPRIIYIKNAVDMAGTFSTTSSGSRPSWFSELLLAVQARRRDVGPTTIVLGLTPTVLQAATSTVGRPKGVFSFLQAMQQERTGVTPARSEKTLWAASAETRLDVSKELALAERIEAMWEGRWGSLLPPFEGVQSQDSTGSKPPRSIQDIFSRLGPPSGFPGAIAGMSIPFTVVSASGGGGSGSRSAKEDALEERKTIWKGVAVLPRVREPERERQTRRETRMQINEMLFKIGAKASQAVLEGSSQVSFPVWAVLVRRIEVYLEEVKKLPAEATPNKKKMEEHAKEAMDRLRAAGEESGVAAALAIQDEFKTRKASGDSTIELPTVEHPAIFAGRLGTVVFPWEDVINLSGLAAGIAQVPAESLTSPSPDASLSPSILKGSKPHYEWKHLRIAYGRRLAVDAQFKTFLEKNPLSAKDASSAGDAKSSSTAPSLDNKPDPVVEAVKKDPKLTAHEKKIIGTIVDPKLIRDTFSDVHLPEKTVDAIRSVVSLPLLFPEAFSTGILKNHSTSGALLFGPPGTGKTLLVRALAKESGARMMSIQPSDVMDMFFGEAEKLVKAVFKIARRLAPCIIFVDEIDALFQARRGGGGGSGGDSARRQMLTEFMQEMDGLNSAAENREKGLILIGATNRPQDLDEAVLRRLPRRLLIDLPGAKEREAILNILLRTETLGPDVDLKQLAKDTPSYSGSDLKHLCVVAAQEAVKELYTIPWLKKKEEASAAASSTPSPPVVDASLVDPSTFASTPEPEVKTEASTLSPTPPTLPLEVSPVIEPTPSPSSPDSPSPSTSSLDPSSDDKSAAEPAPQPTPSSDTTLLPLPVDPVDITIEKEATAPTPTVKPFSSETPESISLKIKPRVLTAAHFKIALANSSSSGSEEVGALPELRKWNEQFGDAGTKKNKKSGFGKGFGFGLSDEKDSKLKEQAT